MSRRLYDAHNHLQDERFGGRQSELLAACAQMGVAAMVVNGSREADWPQVLALARSAVVPAVENAARVQTSRLARTPAPPASGSAAAGTAALRIIPSFGYHPWYIHERTADWLTHLAHFLGEVPSAVGEIGLDRWKRDLAYAGQEEVFIIQLRLAAERNLPVSIHCLQAWGRMMEILQSEPRPARGFLFHSYSGPKEMVMPFADLGAYFSLPGYYANERKARQRESFQHVPAERLLIETDAPDQQLPSEPSPWGQERLYALADAATGKTLNHPANLAAVYAFAADLRGMAGEALVAQVQANFLRLFGKL